MLTSWDALLDLMEKVVGAAGDRAAEAGIGELRRVLDRMDKDTFVP